MFEAFGNKESWGPKVVSNPPDDGDYQHHP